MRHAAAGYEARMESRCVNTGFSCDDAMRAGVAGREEPQKERSDSEAFDTQRLDGRDSEIGIGTGTCTPFRVCGLDDSVFFADHRRKRNSAQRQHPSP